MDIVLLIEAVNDKFLERFIAFIEAGGYQHINKGTGKSQFYRFQKPNNFNFPYMIELFSRKPDFLQSIDSRLTPVRISDEGISLSAILLDDEYYALLTNGIIDVEGLSVLSIECLILYKIKDWLDLSERRSMGENVDSKNIRKHKNDVLRLAIDMELLGVRGVTYQEVLENIRVCYEL